MLAVGGSPPQRRAAARRRAGPDRPRRGPHRAGVRPGHQRPQAGTGPGAVRRLGVPPGRARPVAARRRPGLDRARHPGRQDDREPAAALADGAGPRPAPARPPGGGPGGVAAPRPGAGRLGEVRRAATDPGGPARSGPVWVFDPTGATGWPAARWSPLAAVGSYGDAMKAAAWLTDSSKVDGRGWRTSGSGKRSAASCSRRC